MTPSETFVWFSLYLTSIALFTSTRYHTAAIFTTIKCHTAVSLKFQCKKRKLSKDNISKNFNLFNLLPKVDKPLLPCNLLALTQNCTHNILVWQLEINIENNKSEKKKWFFYVFCRSRIGHLFVFHFLKRQKCQTCRFCRVVTLRRSSKILKSCALVWRFREEVTCE